MGLADSCPNKDTENAWTLYEMSISSSTTSSSSTTTTSCSWSGHGNMVSAGFAAGVDESFSLGHAMAKCIELGDACKAITCDSGDANAVCTVRASATPFTASTSGEITYDASAGCSTSS